MSQPRIHRKAVPRSRRMLGLLLGCMLCVALGGTPAAAQTVAPHYLPLLAGPPRASVLIAAAHIDPARSGEADEAILLWNTGPQPVDLAGWRLVANGRTATFPTHDRLVLAARARLWCAAEATAFAQSFGHSPDCEWAADDDPTLPNLIGAPRLTNTGGAIQLLDPGGRVVDALLYGQAAGPLDGWQGSAAQLYTRGAVAASGQVWERKRSPLTGLPLDSDRASDWTGDLNDIAWGRRVRFPGWGGWDTGSLDRPVELTASATVTVAIAPEGLYAPIAAALSGATETIDLSLYTFEHPELADIIAAAARRGVRVRLLLEGGPPGGISDLQRWCVRHMAQAGVEVRYSVMLEGAPSGMQPRYRYTHAKTGIIDERLALVGSENFSRDAMPLPGPQPQGGRRGAYLLVDSSAVAAALGQVFAADWQPDRFLDLQPYAPDHARYGDPPPGYTLPAPSPVAVEAVPFAAAVTATGEARFALVVAPEHALRPDAGLLALLDRAGPGDAILWTQLYEHLYWYLWLQPIMDAHPKTDTGDKLPALLPQLPV